MQGLAPVGVMDEARRKRMSDRTNLQLRSLITEEGLELSLQPAPIPSLAPDEVLVEVHATPISPSDLGLLVGPADVTTAVTEGDGEARTLKAQVPPAAMKLLQARLGQSMPVGNEGAGRVVEAGASPEAQALLGQLVSARSGAAFARYARVKAQACLPLPPGAAAVDGASAFVNPMTALGILETMRAESHTALVHTAAASNLGQMLNRICLADGVGLVNVVRSPAQVTLLRAAGAVHVCDTSQPDFMDSLRAALRATGATLAFDAVGGGRLANDILQAMEDVDREGRPFSIYGAPGRKQLYVYGALNLEWTGLSRTLGFSWSVGAWLLTYFLQSAGPQVLARMQARVAAELTTTFASTYSRTISLGEALDRDVFWAYLRRGTGEKYLVDPRLGA